MTNRTEVPEDVIKLITESARELGYTAKRRDAAKSRWKFVVKAIEYAKQNAVLFRL